jgi:peptidoglycan/LPS O-acetylase OafA/YrhL
MKEQSRVSLLDSFRFLAILMVIFYHYYSRWTMPISKLKLYDYDYSFDIFKYGYLGVEFFFIISGFVIYFTLTKTQSKLIFLKKRFIRLFPTMLLCSVLTFLFFLFFDENLLFPNSHNIKNVIFSCTFLSPNLAEQFGFNLVYIDGSYWSLWVEIQFYFISCFIYFINPKKFLFHFGLISIFLFFGHIALNSNLGSELIITNFSNEFYEFILNFCRILNLSEYVLWFLMGMIFYELFQNKKKYKLLILLFFVVTIQFFFLKYLPIILISSFFIILFLLMIYKPNWIAFLNNKFFIKIGVVSYSLYLIHQNIGVLIINKMSDLIKTDYMILIPLVIIVLLINFSFFIFKYFEKPISIFFKSFNNDGRKS